MKITFANQDLPKSGAAIVYALAGRKLSASAAQLDKQLAGALTRAMANSRFKGDKGQTLEVLAPGKGDLTRVLLLGMGAAKDITDLMIENAAASAVKRLNSSGENEATLIVDSLAAGRDTGADAARSAFGALLESYRFDKYRTKEKPDAKPTLKKLVVATEPHKEAKKAYAALEEIAAGVFTTRDIVSEPANIIYPQSFVAEARKLEKLGVEIEVLGEKEMAKLGMGSLLGVGQGSARESQLLIMRWNGLAAIGKAKAKTAKAAKAASDAPLLVVGKGVTFDTGGISIKPAGGMEDMKWDMGGAGTVLGLMRALAGRKARADVVGICGLVENMPDGAAQRPGDVVTSMSGQTIEVINTDAEGRLVLADALWFGQEKFQPKAVIDLATLTGAIIISLGHEHAGLFSNDDGLSDQLLEAGLGVGEKLWRLPLGEAYDKAINSDIADMKNTGNRAGGSITAAQFLQRFIKQGTPWAHLDIAGVAWTNEARPTVPKGATAFGVRLLDRLVAKNYES
ncbi:leucyl aminopeptidase [Limibacillus halophilus]|uniref:Probable cytosol aminopeptidase n=1 Tax=Limibacillus halophilus TaxID=1579333 RepID=A0A839SSU0_9PROT|nr:leucyl aminopeptidase [Limibacillus halophilus]MBB3065049.1 leucyl aminopeptidase [Limibacillus halophilus]